MQFRVKMEEEIELSLGLSLNGRFGVNPKSGSNNLIRSSSSISNFLEIPSLPLTRTISLPVEVEDETRKRKEIQMLRRMAAKRKRSEKQRREIGGNKVGFSGHGLDLKPGFGNGTPPDVQISGHGLDIKPGMGNGVMDDGVRGGIFAPPLSRGSSGSSSGASELESQTSPPTQGMNKNTEAKSPQSVQSFSDQPEQRPILWPGDPKRLKKIVNTHLNPSRSISEASNIVLADMPCVSTKEGPNLKRVEGFLYRYRKGEDLRIVCVCHGSFLTPSEFIKHAGGGDVEHPLRHIVVKPSPFL